MHLFVFIFMSCLGLRLEDGRTRTTESRRLRCDIYHIGNNSNNNNLMALRFRKVFVSLFYSFYILLTSLSLQSMDNNNKVAMWEREVICDCRRYCFDSQHVERTVVDVPRTSQHGVFLLHISNNSTCSVTWLRM